MDLFADITGASDMHARRVVCIQPHYDDNDLFAGGTLALLHNLGAELIYLTVTDDLVGVLDQTLTDEQMQFQLRSEQVQAGKIIGVDQYFWLAYPDAGPYDYYRLRIDIIANLRLLRPDYVFTVDPWLPNEAHRDHVLTGLAAAEAVYLMNFPRIKTRDEIDQVYEPYEIQAIAFYLTASPNVVIDISQTVEQKHRAVQAYKAEFSEEDLVNQIRELEMTERIVGEVKHYHQAEQFKFVSPSQLHCNTGIWKSQV